MIIPKCIQFKAKVSQLVAPFTKKEMPTLKTHNQLNWCRIKFFKLDLAMMEEFRDWHAAYKIWFRMSHQGNSNLHSRENLQNITGAFFDDRQIRNSSDHFLQVATVIYDFLIPTSLFCSMFKLLAWLLIFIKYVHIKKFCFN